MSVERFRDCVAVVTGGGRNIGAEIAAELATEGATVVLIDNDEARARQAAAGAGAEPYVCDVSSPEQVTQAFQEVRRAHGAIDVLVNNVAVTDRQSVLTLPVDEWDRVLAVTLRSVFLCTQAVARIMVADGTPGAIVNIASTSGYRGRANSTAYPAAKAGVLNLTRTLAVQLAPHHIRVNSVTPNQVGSPVGEDEERPAGAVRNLVGRVGVPADIAAAVLWLASDEAGFVTGADLLVDGGILAGF